MALIFRTWKIKRSQYKMTAMVTNHYYTIGQLIYSTNLPIDFTIHFFSPVLLYASIKLYLVDLKNSHTFYF